MPGRARKLKSNNNAVARNSAKRVVFVSGYFRILHPGHLRLLKFAKGLGDYLVIGVMCCQEESQQIDNDTRLKLIQALDFVDEAFLITESIENAVQSLKPAIVVKGKEHEFRDNPEKAILDTYNGKLIFSSGETYFSPGELAQDNIRPLSNYLSALDYLQRHHFTFDDLKSQLASFSKLKVCVIGDTIIDEYIQCDAVGMSQEDPTIVVTPQNTERFLGGAAIVAAHLKSLGAAKVSLFSVLGEDEAGTFAKKKCLEYGVDQKFVIDDSRPTTLKQRFRSKNKTLLRVNHFRQHQISQDLQKELCNKTLSALNDADLVIFSDFSYGALPQPLVNKISKVAKEKEIMMVADSQCSSQTGDITRFQGATFVSPTEHEARVSLKNNEDGLVILAEKLRQRTKAKHVFITMAEQGVLIHPADPENKEFTTDQLPALNLSARDSAGAGDCFMAMTAMSMAVGARVWEAAYLGSLAAAIQVSRVGNLPLHTQNILAELNLPQGN